MKRYLILILFLIVLFSWGIAHAESLYVLPDTVTYNGDGSAPTEAEEEDGAGAWQGFANVQWSADAGDVGPGDTLYLVAGETYAENLAVGIDGTNSTTRVTISVYDTGTATIDCEDATRNGITVSARDYITIDGVTGNAIDGDETYGLQIVNIKPGYSGIGGSSVGNDIIITRVEMSGSETTGGNDNTGGVSLMGGVGSTREVSYCWIHGPTAANGDDSLRWYAAGVVIWSVEDGTTYTKTKIHHNLGEGFRTDGIKTNFNCSIYNNEVRYIGASVPGHCDTLNVQSGTYAKVYNNYIHHLQGSGIYMTNVSSEYVAGPYWIYNNVVGVRDSTRGCIILQGTNEEIDDVRIFNNTFYEADFRPIGLEGAHNCTNVYIKNNIIGRQYTGTYALVQAYYAGGSTCMEWADNDAYDYNMYSVNGQIYPDIATVCPGGNATLAELQALSPAREANGFDADATFVDAGGGNFHLTSGSRGVDEGVDLSAWGVTTDKDGVDRGSTWCMGAYEYHTEVDDEPPVISNIVPLPTVQYPDGTIEVTVTWDTNECAVCRIGESDEADEDDLTYLAAVETRGACGVGYGTQFSYEFTSLSDGDSVTAYIGGEDESEGNETTDNAESAFTIYDPPPSGARLLMVWE